MTNKQKRFQQKHLYAYPFNQYLMDRNFRDHFGRKIKKRHDINKVRRAVASVKKKCKKQGLTGSMSNGVTIWRGVLENIQWYCFR